MDDNKKIAVRADNLPMDAEVLSKKKAKDDLLKFIKDIKKQHEGKNKYSFSVIHTECSPLSVVELQRMGINVEDAPDISEAEFVEVANSKVNDPRRRRSAPPKNSDTRR